MHLELEHADEENPAAASHASKCVRSSSSCTTKGLGLTRGAVLALI